MPGCTAWSLTCAVFATTVLSASGFWNALPPLPSDFVKPGTWGEKSFGQWCRNFTTDIHRQCPEGSFIHWYTCCGPESTDCCIGIQSWAYVVSGYLILVAVICLAFACLLRANYIFTEAFGDDKPVKVLLQTTSAGAASPSTDYTCIASSSSGSSIEESSISSVPDFVADVV